jgi:hypothetical protein
MAQAIVPPVIGMVAAPLLIGITLIQFVVGITSKFFLLPQPPPGTLAVPFAAVALILDTWIRKEEARAMDTPNLNSHGFPRKNHERPCGASKGRKISK